jgi:hypothetical protein
MFPSVHYRNRLIVINNRLNRLIVLTRPQWSTSLPRRGRVLKFLLDGQWERYSGSRETSRVCHLITS